MIKQTDNINTLCTFKGIYNPKEEYKDGDMVLKDNTSYVYLNNKFEEILTSTITYTPVVYDTIATWTPDNKQITYIHQTTCPQCGGLLDGDENSPKVKCRFCGAISWSIREIS